ncbi:MAG: hypothetical protein R2771_09990 [Saprospiraceae bacterium]
MEYNFLKTIISRISNIVADEENNKIYTSAYGYGLVEFNMDDESIVFYNDIIQELVGTDEGDDRKIRDCRYETDDENNLWMTMYGCEYPLVVKNISNGVWYKFQLPGNNYCGEFDFDDAGRLWIRMSKLGVLVWRYEFYNQ